MDSYLADFLGSFLDGKEREALQARYERDFTRYAELRGLPMKPMPPPAKHAEATAAAPAKDKKGATPATPADPKAGTPAEPATPPAKKG